MIKPHTLRNNITPGIVVDIVLKKDQPTGILTRGIVKRVLSPGGEHHRGIKVMLLDNQVGRVQKILSVIYYYSNNKCQKIMTPNEFKYFGKSTEDLGIFPDWIICRTSKLNKDIIFKYEHLIIVDDLNVRKWIILLDLHNKSGLITSHTNQNTFIMKNNGDSTESLINSLAINPNKNVLLYIDDKFIHPWKINTIK